MASLAVRVMAHHKRQHLIPDLISRLEIDESAVIWDLNDDRWDTGRRAWESMIGTGADWGCVIQDDAIVCRDFVPGLSAALEHVPSNALVAPFNGTGIKQTRSYRLIRNAVMRADDQGASWIAMSTLMCGVALAMPASMIADVMEWCDQQTWPEYDRRIGQYFLQHRQPVWSTHPSLVDHRDDEPSLTSHATGRIAHRFIGEDASALDVDWSGSVTVIRGAISRPSRSRERSSPPSYQ